MHPGAEEHLLNIKEIINTEIKIRALNEKNIGLINALLNISKEAKKIKNSTIQEIVKIAIKNFKGEP
jgi:hypothetical protein